MGLGCGNGNFCRIVFGYGGTESRSVILSLLSVSASEFERCEVFFCIGDFTQGVCELVNFFASGSGSASAFIERFIVVVMRVSRLI